MPYMLVQHEVEDFAKWKVAFDAFADLRKSNGEQSVQLFQDAQNPNAITALFGWDSVENAQKYAQSPELKAGMQEAGVTGPPSVSFLTEV